MPARDLLRRMADAYAGAQTYADRGRVRRLHRSESSESVDRKSFATFLDRRHGTRISYEPRIDVPLDPALFVQPRRKFV